MFFGASVARQLEADGSLSIHIYLTEKLTLKVNSTAVQAYTLD
jgi:hypothetical protein